MLHSTKVKDQRIDDTNTITFLYFFIFLILKQFEIITGVYFGRYSNYCGTTSMKALETLIGLPKILDQWRSRKLDGLFYSKFVNYPRIGWSSNLGLNNITENGWKNKWRKEARILKMLIVKKLIGLVPLSTMAPQWVTCSIMNSHLRRRLPIHNSNSSDDL